MDVNKIYNSDCIEGMKLLPDNCIDCCVTSPPYFGLRDYGNDGQIGLEETPELFITKLMEVFNEVRRVLKPEGTLWLNLGDSYNGNKQGNTNGTYANGVIDKGKAYATTDNFKKKLVEGLKPKDLIGIPWMAAFALRSAGWYLRQDIIWHKPNPMPESVTDRCTKSHEYIFLLSKSQKYYYDQDAIRTTVKDSTVQRMMQQIEDQKGSERVPGKTNGTMKAVGPGRNPAPHDSKGGNQGSAAGIKAMRANGITRDRLLNYDSKEKVLRGNENREAVYNSESEIPLPDGKANKKSVWTVTTKPFSEAHFATFPEDLIVDCIKAGCPEDGIVIDPFMGAGTTGLVARKLNRNYIGYELNPEYIKIAEKRIFTNIGLFQ